MVKAAAAEAPPPGEGFETVTLAVPAVAISADDIVASSCVVLTKVVVRADPFQLTAAPLTKLLPFTVRVKAPLPAVALEGDNEEITGTGLDATVVIVPPVPERLSEVPSGSAPNILPIEMGMVEPPLPLASVNVGTATIPLPIAFVFIPAARQVTEPVAVAQVIVLPAAVSTGPAATLTEEMRAGE
jgi:hypothetical protein